MEKVTGGRIKRGATKFVLFNQYFRAQNEDVMSGSCNMHVKYEDCVQSLLETWTVDKPVERRGRRFDGNMKTGHKGGRFLCSWLWSGIGNAVMNLRVS